MPTAFEKEILRKRLRQGKVVPLLEELFKRPLEIEDEEDRQFLLALFEKRSKQRHQRGHYSPSMLASCQRAVYFARTGEPRARVVDPRAQGFFAQGNFMHLKWQFAMWRLYREGKIELVKIKGDTKPYGFEVYVENKRGDFSGHIDVFPRIEDVPYILDFKGWQAHLYQRMTMGYVPEDAAIQLAGYMSILRVDRRINFSVDTGLLVVESKSGPDERGSPLGLIEVEIDRKTWQKEVNKRMREQRDYEANQETPEPSCHSTRQRQFQTCPWSGRCLAEVKQIQEREKAARRNSDEFRVRIPEGRGTANSRKPRRRRS